MKDLAPYLKGYPAFYTARVVGALAMCIVVCCIEEGKEEEEEGEATTSEEKAHLP